MSASERANGPSDGPSEEISGKGFARLGTEGERRTSPTAVPKGHPAPIVRQGNRFKPQKLDPADRDFAAGTRRNPFPRKVPRLGLSVHGTYAW